MNYTTMDDQTRERASLLFSALSNPVRLKIVELLCEGERTVGEVATAMGVGQSGASQHLATLTRAGILKVEPRGTSRFYKVRGPRIPQILLLINEFCHVHSLFGPTESEPENEL